MNKVKIYEKKIVTTDENGLKEIWEIDYFDGVKEFIRFKGKVWNLVKSGDKNYKLPED